MKGEMEPVIKPASRSARTTTPPRQVAQHPTASSSSDKPLAHAGDRGSAEIQKRRSSDRPDASLRTPEKQKSRSSSPYGRSPSPPNTRGGESSRNTGKVIAYARGKARQLNRESETGSGVATQAAEYWAGETDVNLQRTSAVQPKQNGPDGGSTNIAEPTRRQSRAELEASQKAQAEARRKSRAAPLELPTAGENADGTGVRKEAEKRGQPVVSDNARRGENVGAVADGARKGEGISNGNSRGPIKSVPTNTATTDRVAEEREQASKGTATTRQQAKEAAALKEAEELAAEKAARDARFAEREAALKAKQQAKEEDAAAGRSIHAAPEAIGKTSAKQSVRKADGRQSPLEKCQTKPSTAPSSPVQPVSSPVQPRQLIQPECTVHSDPNPLCVGSRTEALKQVYRAFDLDSDGMISSFELLQLGHARRRLGQRR